MNIFSALVALFTIVLPAVALYLFISKVLTDLYQNDHINNIEIDIDLDES